MTQSVDILLKIKKHIILILIREVRTMMKQEKGPGMFKGAQHKLKEAPIQVIEEFISNSRAIKNLH